MAKSEENIQNNSVLNNNNEVNAIAVATVEDRQSEILAAAYKYYPDSNNEFIALVRAAFICGARWADMYPKCINK